VWIAPGLALSRTPKLCLTRSMIGYARAQSDNSLSLQRDKLRAAGCDRLFEDRRAGNTVVRPGLEQALGSLAPGDTLCVCRLDRLVWDTRDLLSFALTLSERGVHLVALAQDIDTRRDNGAFFAFAATLADHDRGIRADRLAESRGRQKRPGRPPAIADET
jgi:DNA invertase Pin-like site-specific DNA recombinase